MEFSKLKNAISQQWAFMSRENYLFKTDVDKDLMWETYLSSFPAGTNSLYRERTEHDCSACRQFVKAVGNVVAIIDNKLVSVWDAEHVLDPDYQVVLDAMSQLVKSYSIQNRFLTSERVAGVDRNYEQLEDGRVQEWTHLFVNIPAHYWTRSHDVGSKLSNARATHDVLARGLREITFDAIDTVRELIAQNSLYKGVEYKSLIQQFSMICHEWHCLTSDFQDNYVWFQSVSQPINVCRIRNTAMGTLLINLSEGKELEDAVRAYENMVAPTNYRRSSALITPRMITQAQEKVEELGLTSALRRRHATVSDVSVNDVLFANRQVQKDMQDNVFDNLISTTVKKVSKNLDKVEEVTIEKFISDILPHAESLELMVENRHTKNLMSITTAEDATANKLFNWDNHFSWSYTGDVTDSIKEKVKKAGGNVTGDLCCRLAWFNYDDLDLHMVEPDGNEIFFGERISRQTGGRLDVDMNVTRTTREPVENIFYKDRSRMTYGTYKLYVYNYTPRETKDVGFEVEIDFMGETYTFCYDQLVRNSVDVVTFTFGPYEPFKIIQSLPMTTRSKSAWGLTTQSFVPVNMMMFSPNHWGDQHVGNKHYMFILDGCKAPDPVRSIYNEYLKPELNVHRKVFEVLGDKLKAPFSENQLSGVGFSSTQ